MENNFWNYLKQIIMTLYFWTIICLILMENNVPIKLEKLNTNILKTILLLIKILKNPY
jgi:hypothetical protein